jgi:hypothetical protein
MGWNVGTVTENVFWMDFFSSLVIFFVTKSIPKNVLYTVCIISIIVFFFSRNYTCHYYTLAKTFYARALVLYTLKAREDTVALAEMHWPCHAVPLELVSSPLLQRS